MVSFTHEGKRFLMESSDPLALADEMQSIREADVDGVIHFTGMYKTSDGKYVAGGNIKENRNV